MVDMIGDPDGPDLRESVRRSKASTKPASSTRPPDTKSGKTGAGHDMSKSTGAESHTRPA